MSQARKRNSPVDDRRSPPHLETFGPTCDLRSDQWLGRETGHSALCADRKDFETARTPGG